MTIPTESASICVASPRARSIASPDAAQQLADCEASRSFARYREASRWEALEGPSTFGRLTGPAEWDDPLAGVPRCAWPLLFIIGAPDASPP